MTVTAEGTGLAPATEEGRLQREGPGLRATHAGQAADQARPPAIAAVDIVKEYHTELGTRRVLDGVSFSVSPGERMAILGRNGAGKSTLIRILSGLVAPTSGQVHLGLTLSWPLGLSGAFDGMMTGYDNVRFLSDVYNLDMDDTLAFVEDFAELGKMMYTPVRFYSDGMRARLNFGLSLAVDFDCILIDELLAVGDPRFQAKCQHEIFEKRRDRAMIIAIHSGDFVRERCTSALVLKNGRGRVFDDVGLAVDIYHSL